MEYKGGVLTILSNRAEEKGHQEGVQVGIQIGKRENQQETLLKLLGCKFGDIPQAFKDKVSTATMDRLDVWTKNILFKDTIEEVLS